MIIPGFELSLGVEIVPRPCRIDETTASSTWQADFYDQLTEALRALVDCIVLNDFMRLEPGDTVGLFDDEDVTIMNEWDEDMMMMVCKPDVRRHLKAAAALLAGASPVQEMPDDFDYAGLQDDLDELERTDPNVARAAANYDAVVAKITGGAAPVQETER